MINKEYVIINLSPLKCENIAFYETYQNALLSEMYQFLPCTYNYFCCIVYFHTLFAGLLRVSFCSKGVRSGQANCHSKHRDNPGRPSCPY